MDRNDLCESSRHEFNEYGSAAAKTLFEELTNLGACLPCIGYHISPLGATNSHTDESSSSQM